MSRNAVWHDEYWLPLLQLYLRRPVGMKPLYSRPMVELSLELYIPPQSLQSRMKQIARLDEPRIERIWQTYSANPQKLARAVRLLREMKGFGAASEFYDGVEVQESFERDFRPLPEDQRFTPVMLILILDLYFRLTPQTMVAETPEVQELARLIKLKAADVVEVMEVMQYCDPYLNRRGVIFHPLMIPCQDIWRRFGNTDVEALASYAKQLKDFYER